MRKLLLGLVVAGTCLLPSPRTTAAAIPCGSACCLSFLTASSACMYPATVWTTCAAYWALTHTSCPVNQP
jgi:hypothetical protein